MVSLLAEKLPQLSVIVSLAVALLVPGPRLFFQILPEWRERKRKFNTEVFDRLCDAYSQYKELTPDEDTARAQLEFAATDYCGKPVNHRLAAIAFRSDSAVQVFEDLRRSVHKVVYREGQFQIATQPHQFPTKKRIQICSWSALTLYILAVAMLFGGFVSLSLQLFSADISIAVIILALIPGWLTLETAKHSAHLGRLKRIGEAIHAGSSEMQSDNRSE